jgi:translation elongation factor EF-1beta
VVSQLAKLAYRILDDETDMKQLEANMRSIEMDGLTWGASKLVPVGFGIKKLQVNLVVEDEKVSIDDLQGKIEEDEDHVQSTDVVSLLICKVLIRSVLMTITTRPLCKNCRGIYDFMFSVKLNDRERYEAMLLS